MQTGIALFVYNRPWHTQQVLLGLKRNKLQKLYIFSDGAKNEDDKKKVQEVRELIASINWCKTEILESETNKGLARSIVDGVSYILTKYSRIIVLEDDCLPSPDFIDFMEQCLVRYENESKVMSVAGYTLPIEIPATYPYDIYFHYRTESWGWGTWRRAWVKFDYEIKDYQDFIRNKDAQKKFNRGGEDLTTMLKKQMEGKIDSWAVKWAYAHYKNDAYCVFPVKSRIKNIGVDSSGTHCGTRNKYDLEINTLGDYKAGIIKFPSKVFIDPLIHENFLNFLQISLLGKILSFFSRFRFS